MIETQELVETPQAKPLIGGGGRGTGWEGEREREIIDYPVNNATAFPSIYPLDSVLSGG